MSDTAVLAMQVALRHTPMSSTQDVHRCTARAPVSQRGGVEGPWPRVPWFPSFSSRFSVIRVSLACS